MACVEMLETLAKQLAKQSQENELKRLPVVGPVGQVVLRRWARWEESVLEDMFAGLEWLAEVHERRSRISRGRKWRRDISEPIAARREVLRRRTAAVAFARERRRSERGRYQCRARGWVAKMCA